MKDSVIQQLIGYAQAARFLGDYQQASAYIGDILALLEPQTTGSWGVVGSSFSKINISPIVFTEELRSQIQTLKIEKENFFYLEQSVRKNLAAVRNEIDRSRRLIAAGKQRRLAAQLHKD